MNPSFYWMIAVLAVYGDLLKRFVPGQAALGMLYVAAIALLAVLWLESARHRADGESSGAAAPAAAFALLLAAIYIAQFLTDFDAPLLDSFNHMLYMVVPLAYLAVVQQCGKAFRLESLAHAFLVLMIPVNAVGAVQYLLDPNFLISTAYSGPLGGVVERNLLGDGGSFMRFPSMFASADRYSAMGLMQFLFAFVLLSRGESAGRHAHGWIAFNIACGLIALGISGARSRILLAMFELALLSAVYLRTVLLAPAHTHRGLLTSLALGLVAFSSLIYYVGAQDAPILLFLEQSFTEGDIESRVDVAWQASLLKEDVSWFGEGLGTIGGGKPGEFGVSSMWQESGLVWGTMLLAGFAGLLAVTGYRSLQCALVGRAADIVLVSLPFLMIVTALLTGLTSAFELSSGVLLGCATAVAADRPRLQVYEADEDVRAEGSWPMTAGHAMGGARRWTLS